MYQREKQRWILLFRLRTLDSNMDYWTAIRPEANFLTGYGSRSTTIFQWMVQLETRTLHMLSTSTISEEPHNYFCIRKYNHTSDSNGGLHFSFISKEGIFCNLISQHEQGIP